MRAQLTAGHHTVGMHTQFEDEQRNERHSSFVENGARWQLYHLGLFEHFFRFSVLPAISLEKGILHCEVVEGSFRADTFALFIQNVLEHMEPFPGPNSVIVMDNCRIHKSPYIQELIRARVCCEARSAICY